MSVLEGIADVLLFYLKVSLYSQKENHLLPSKESEVRQKHYKFQPAQLPDTALSQSRKIMGKECLRKIYILFGMER
ncbi:hypothetical protein [Alloprevotella rava]|uniref:hypothetical protein n=1 Tax=Alloprevotella rava TaxID=671218 RepID=UPI0002EEE5E7|nr:hypothetical protein [Alloprevotella rava]